MAKDLRVIYNQEVLGQDFKIYGTEENPLFLAKDVASWIEHSKPSIMIETVDEDEKLKETIFTSGQNREMWFLTEDGLYEVLMQSRKPIAKQFKKKVKEILKQIRQTGGYIQHDDEDDDATIMARALIVAQKTIENKNKKLKLAEDENIKLSKIIEDQKPKMEYLDEILNCTDAMLVTNIAFDYGLSARALNRILCEERVQRKVRNQYILYAEYMGKGYTTTETDIYGGKPRTQTLWTQKGRMLIHQILRDRGIKPLSDRALG